MGLEQHLHQVSRLLVLKRTFSRVSRLTSICSEGCPLGKCLRSHVNKTETEYALAMITRAGIPSTKIVPGLALYGRSYEMANKSCKGPECTFTSKDSGATKGVCTNTCVPPTSSPFPFLIGRESAGPCPALSPFTPSVRPDNKIQC